MKSKFFLSLTLVAALASVSVISSCKDTDEDLRNEMLAGDAANKAQVDALKSELDALKARVQKLEDAAPATPDLTDIKAEIKKVADALADYKTLNDQAVKSLQDDVKKINESIEALQKALEPLKNAVTGVILQGSVNPMFGTLSAPTGLNSMVLLAYYNEAVASPVFPGEFIEGYTGANYEVTSGEMLLSDAANNAGTLYLTVNPSNNDFTGVELNLVNSQEKVSGVKLSALKKSDKVLTFGYTRADNGFYEASASVSEEGIKDGSVQVVDLNVKSVGKDLKNLLNGRPNLQEVTALIGDVYTSINNVCDANAVKVERGEGLGNIYSEYGIAAVALKPLSFNTLDDVYTSSNMPGYASAQNAINRIVNTVKNHLNLKQFDIKKLNLQKIEISDTDYITISFVYNGETCTSKVSKKEVLGDVVDTLNNDLTKLQDYIDQVNELLVEYNSINDKIENGVRDALNSLLDKVNKNVVNYINKATHMLKPCLAINTNEGARMASASVEYPTVISAGKVTLIPTSYTVEVLAPALKKYVSVKNVTTGAEVAAEQLGTVIDGSVRAIDVNLQSGNTYEITYLALDYTGQVANLKYYVTVK